jgi:Ca2+-binding EF-hand superfamily protein
VDELADLMKSLNNPPTEQEIINMKAEVDVDQSGNIDFKEYITLIARKMRDTDMEEEMVEAFKVFDSNNDGLISKDELKFVMQVLGERVWGETISEEDLNIMFGEADKDMDGYINYQEFCNIINEH